MTRINATITTFRSTNELKQIADQIANHVVMIDKITGKPIRKETTPRAHDIIASIVLGALMHINKYAKWSIGQTIIQTTADAATSQLIAAMLYNMKAFGLTGDSDYYVDAYETIYEPLRTAIRDWASES